MKQRVERQAWMLVAIILAALTPGEAIAYIGPGGGLSLLSTALAMLAAFSVSVMVVLTWPVRAVRRWLRRRRDAEKADGSEESEERSEEKR